MRSLRGGQPAGMSRHRVGNALVLHAHERISVAARSLALAVAEDPAYDIVVLDLHDELPIGAWRAVATALRRHRRGIRLVVCGASADTGALAAQWLCDRLRRPVVTPHGRIIRAADGTLLAGAADGGGWVRYRPGRSPVWDAQRYPAPAWDAAAARFRVTSAVGAVEPLPGGVWIRDTRDPAVISERWRWLVSALPCQPDVMTVVLGCPGTPPLAVDDVARFWRGLDPDGRHRARFVQYGPVALPAGEVLGQRLADVLESPVVCLGGIPVGRPDRTQMRTVTPDGGPGWQVLVRELCFTPRATPGAAAKLPRILSHRAPALLGEPVGPLSHRYAADAVVEIVQSGLWIRADDTPRNAGRVRAHPADPSRHALIVDDTVPSRVARFRELAEDLAARLDPDTRARSTLHLASAVAAGWRGRPGGRADDNAGDGLTHRFTAADLAFPPTPAPDARGLPTPAGLDAERAWLRRRFGREFDVAADSVSRLLTEHPHLHVGGDSVVDAVAVRLYLSGAGESVDGELRSGSAGDSVSFARCVAAGVARLPSYRGAACLSATLSAAELREIAARETLTDRGFTHALTEPPMNVPGNVDVLLWSMTARRTRLLEPADEQRAAGRVLFLPGTRFRVLETTPAGDGRPGRLLLRELSAEEPVRERGPFDDLALTSLIRCHERWAATGRRARVGSAAVPRFAHLPGLV
ncbi:hypothetical protein O7602_19725 [Micromonospora sp. WMMD1128]|uniref:hypothetical protein n=1 Tax=Micromonospora sp. WMMD1128 TaxID=3015150 RepID=UPI00248D1522|nr:hypothetical protein [Micromonospora sp. WMMD1128]WBB71957.1 hypothetical protein O7602_19725 [Micromonospora sp. WMMD1128]